MRRRNIRELVLARLPHAGDDRGSLAMLLLVILVATMLGGMLLSSIIGQNRTTRFDMTRVHSLDAAQAGIDVVLGSIRIATTTVGSASTTNGDVGLLPCGPWSGTTNGAASATYTATVKYYTTDPKTALNAMLCTSAGPYDSGLNTRTPRFATITSTGVDGAQTAGASKGRTLQTTYVFQTNDANVSGGLIRIFPASTGGPWCMDAGSAPAVNTAVKLQACSTTNPPADPQVWTYRSDLSIELVSSAKTTPTGLCIDTSPTAHVPTPDAIVLKACSVPDASVCPAGFTPATYAAAHLNDADGPKTCKVSTYNQQWSVDDNAHLHGATVDQTNTDGYCINTATQTAGQALNLIACAGSVTDTAQTWIPSPTTGAGMAGAGNHQLVNYRQFATCLDVTGQDVTSTYMILYTCKQNPNPANVAWNQKFIPSPAVATIPTKVMLTTTTTAGTKYCLRSPLTPGGYPTLSSPCPANVTLAAGTGFLWTVSTLYSDAAGTKKLAYADRYTIKDINSQCLGPGGNNDLLNGQYLKAVVTTCDGSTAQKWNADASIGASTLTNTHETES